MIRTATGRMRSSRWPLGLLGFLLGGFQNGEVALLFGKQLKLAHGTVVELHERERDDEHEGHQRIEVIGNGADEQLDAAHAGVESFSGRGHGGGPGRDRRDHADGRGGRVDEVGQLGPGDLVPISDGAHDRADGQAVEIVVNEDQHAEHERGQLCADARLDVRLGPAAERGGAACLVDQRDNDAEQDEEEEDTGVVCNGGDESGVDNGVERGDRMEVRGEQRANDHADEQRAVRLFRHKGENNRNQRRDERPRRLGEGCTVCTANPGDHDEDEHRGDHNDRHERVGFFLVHGFSSYKKMRHDTIMTQKNHNMTALHFRDSPCDVLPRPRAMRAGADKALRRPPLFTPRRLPDGWRVLLLAATSIITVLYYTKTSEFVNRPDAKI